MTQYDIIINTIGESLKNAEDTVKSLDKLLLSDRERRELQGSALGLADESRRTVEAARAYKQSLSHFMQVSSRIIDRIEKKEPLPSTPSRYFEGGSVKQADPIDTATGEGRR